MQAAGGDRDQPAHRVPDEHRRALHAAVVGAGHHLVGPRLDGVHRAPAAVAVARQVDGDDVVLRQEQRRDEAPPVGVGGAAVDEHEAGALDVAPAQVVDVARLDPHRALLGRRGDGRREPRGPVGSVHRRGMVPPARCSFPALHRRRVGRRRRTPYGIGRHCPSRPPPPPAWLAAPDRVPSTSRPSAAFMSGLAAGAMDDPTTSHDSLPTRARGDRGRVVIRDVTHGRWNDEKHAPASSLDQDGKRTGRTGKGRVTPVIPGHSRSTTVTRKPGLSRAGSL